MQITSTQVSGGVFDVVRAPRILLLEQDAAVREATRLLLKSDGYRVSAAASLAEALEQLTEDPDVDLLVIGHYSCHKGMQLVAAIRDRLDRPLRAVLMTEDSPPDDFKAVSLTRVVTKPVNELLTLIRTWLVAD